MNLSKVPPNNQEAERSFLSCLLLNNQNISKYAIKIQPEDFYASSNQVIYKAFLKLSSKGIPATLPALHVEIKNKNILSELLELELDNCEPHDSYIDFFASKIKNASIRRKQIKLAQKILQEAHNEQINPESSIEELKSILEKSNTSDETGIVQPSELFEKIDELYEKGLKRGYSTGWLKLDDYYTVAPGQITVITGVPSHGKSSWNTNLITNMAQRHSWKFAVFSPENFPMQRYCAHIAQIYTGKPFTFGNRERIQKNELEPAKLWIDEHFVFIVPKSDEMRIENLIQKATICVLKHGVKGIVFDPWNEIDHTRPQGLNETEYISKCLSKLRYFARAYQVHIWLIAHPTKLLKRQDGTYPVPTPYDISGSANFRNKADCCLTVWRDLNSNSLETDIHVQKVRFHEIGKIGVVKMDYNPITQSYS